MEKLFRRGDDFMISTITLNPSIDRRYIVDNFEKDGIFRAKEIHQTAGGKGINVARVIKLLGEPVLTSGFIGGKSGEFILDELNRLEIKNDFVHIKGETRSCIAILSNDSSQTEILEPGPEILDEEMNIFLKKYREILKKTHIVCVSGSLPKRVPVDFYKDMISEAHRFNVKFILDTSGIGLKEGIKALPYLIKPNKEELENLLNTKLKTEKDIIMGAKSLIEEGIEFIVVSLGEKGAIVLDKNRVLKVGIPKIAAKNPVGSGDSMIAGFAVALEKGFDLEKMIIFGTCCGIANAMDDQSGTVNPRNVYSMMDKVVVEELF